MPDANIGTVPASVPLPALLSQALVAHTIELDNEAEHRQPHRTTRQRDPDAGRSGPWLVSFALYANVLQYVDADDVTVAALRAQARTRQLLLGGLLRWGYITLAAPAGQPLRKPPQDDATVRARRAGLRARDVWSPLPAIIDDRWRRRLGAPVFDRLDRALRAVFGALSVEPPAYLPVIHPTQGGKVDAAQPRDVTTGAHLPFPAGGSLSPLLSGVLHAFTLDFEVDARISLPISANTLRVLDVSGTRLGDLPRLTGVSREGNAMCAAWLERHGCAVTGPDTTARRGKVARLTPKGEKAQQKYRRLLRATEESWRAKFGTAAIDDLRAALENVVGDGTLENSPLAPGLVPHPENWRARVPRPEILPHHPMVLHRGGYPDGS
jgi:DNA-binding MarR family transcriptional regulator